MKKTYNKNVCLGPELLKRVEIQFKRWSTTKYFRTDRDGNTYPPNMNQFLKLAIEVYVENLEATDEEEIVQPLT